MTKLRPMLQGEASEAERLLLGSARLDEPPPDGRRRTLAALGLAAGAGTAATSGTAAASTMGPALVAKWVGVGALCGAVAAASVATVVHYADAGRRRTAIDNDPSAAAVQAEASRRHVEGAGVVQGDVVAPEGPAIPPGVASRAPRRAAASQGLSAEIAALDAARRELSAGNGAEALALLDAYDRNFRARTFAQEAAVLRVEALHATGRDSDAARLGEQLLAAEPNSTHAQRVRSLLGSFRTHP